jgi:hypothetical protein
MSFTAASLDARIDAILDAGTRSDSSSRGSAAACAARGRIDARPVLIAGTDPAHARGAIGIAESAVLGAALAAARAERVPLFLLIDSAGAKVDEGLAALGAFRRLYREALLTCLAGIPVYALLGRGCFGGASMLATLCRRRVYSARTLLAASGPAVIQALSGRDQIDASDADAIRTLMGGAARSALGAEEMLTDDDLDGYRRIAIHLIGESTPTDVDRAERHQRLGQRLSSMSHEPATAAHLARLETLIPPGYRCSARGDVLIAQSSSGTGPVFLGVLSGGFIGAQSSWILADELMKLHRSRPDAPVVLVLDAVGHAATRREEELMLSAYISHFSLTAAWLGSMGHKLVLWIPGEAAGAVYVAFSSPADSVSALPSARLRILPQAAVTSIVRTAPEAADDTAAWLRAGVADALLDNRLAVYRSPNDTHS